MSDREAFLRAVIAGPDDDLPRLVFADWLDEHGEPERAEFVRVQCRLDSTYDDAPRDGKGKWDLAGGASLDEYRALRRREGELLERNWDGWHYEGGLTGAMFCENLCKTPPCPTPWIRFRRGFVAEVCTAWGPAALAAILESCPIRNAKDGLVRLTTAPHFAAVSGAYPDGSRDVIVCNGGQWHRLKQPFGTPEFWLEGLGCEFPGVRFELPPAPQQAATLDLVQATLLNMGRPRFAQLLADRLPEFPALSWLLHRDRVRVSRGHEGGNWLHATGAYRIADQALAVARNAEGVVRLIQAGRADAIGGLLVLLERNFRETHGADARNWRMVVLEGQWLRETAVRDHRLRATVIHIDATYLIEPMPEAVP